MCIRDSLDRAHRNAFVLLAKMHLQRAFGLLIGEFADHAAIISDRGFEAGNAAGRQKGRGAAHAESDHAQGTDAFDLVFGGDNVGHHMLEIEIAEVAAGIGNFVGRIAAFEVAYETVEHRGRHRYIAERGQPVADRANVVIDTENFLHHDQPAFRRACRIGAVGAELMLIACVE